MSSLIWWPWVAWHRGGGPVAPEYNPMGDKTPGDLTDRLPVRRSRRRELEDILDEEELMLLSILDEL